MHTFILIFYFNHLAESALLCGQTVSDAIHNQVAIKLLESGARFTKVRTKEFCSTNSLSLCLNYRSNEFVALTNLCETGPWSFDLTYSILCIPDFYILTGFVFIYFLFRELFVISTQSN